MISLILVDPNAALCAAWFQAFEDFPEVSVVNGYFEDLPQFDCMVSAANSFGLMDGGVDLAIIRHFGKDLEKRIQQHIIDHFYGEQPVGTSFLMPVNNPQGQYVAHTPTMRVPRSIVGTDHVYKAMKAMLGAVDVHNRTSEKPDVQSVACPGLGTSIGKMPPKEAARQMALAYRNFVQPITAINWQTAQDRDFEIVYGR
ncbi:MAG: macro domain-containing protein [Bacteroidota bacterium]